MNGSRFVPFRIIKMWRTLADSGFSAISFLSFVSRLVSRLVLTGATQAS